MRPPQGPQHGPSTHPARTQHAPLPVQAQDPAHANNTAHSLIPDGVIKSAHFIKTAAYAQVYGTWDGTKINIVAGDTGGELDPHGAENLGNPIGGNVTSNWGGSDVFYEEWMSFVSSTTFCFRVCTAVVNGVTTAEECEHKLDLLGCGWVMAIPNDAADPGFTSCDGDVAVAPGRYPLPDGSTSTFAQRFTYTANGTPVTIGQTATPAAPALYPSTSNCVTYSTIANGVDPANLMVTAAPTLLQSGSSVVVTGVGSTTMATTTAVVSPVVASSGNNTNAVAGAADATGAAGASSGAGSGSGSSSSGGASASSTGAKSGALGTTSVNTGLVGVVVGAILVGAAAVF